MGYPHPDVDPDPAAVPVQVGVWYSPRVQFYLFDVGRVVGGRLRFLSFADVVVRAEAVGIFCAKPLHIGSLGDCVAWTPRFPTTLPERLGLPAIDGNIAEGIVIKPWDAETEAEARPLCKIKAHEFEEGGGCPPQKGRGEDAMRDFLLSLINPNSVATACSKVGDPSDRRHWPEIVELVLQDIADEAGEDDVVFLGMRDQLRCAAFDLLVQPILREHCTQ